MYARALAIRQVARSTRSYSNAADATGGEFKRLREATKAHAGATSDLWRKISIYVCVPGAIVGALWVKKIEDAHHAHLDHLTEENGGELPERTVYPYMNVRNKPFPWGEQSLFFNPKVNIKVVAE